MTLKTLVLELDEIPGDHDEIFTFHSPETNETYFFNSTKIRAMIDADNSLAQLVKTDIPEIQFRFVMENNGIERAKLVRLAERPDIVGQPILLVEMPNGKVVIIDGNHRFCLRYMLGERSVNAWIIPKSTWEKGLVNFPPEMAPYFLV